MTETEHQPTVEKIKPFNIKFYIGLEYALLIILIIAVIHILVFYVASIIWNIRICLAL